MTERPLARLHVGLWPNAVDFLQCNESAGYTGRVTNIVATTARGPQETFGRRRAASGDVGNCGHCGLTCCSTFADEHERCPERWMRLIVISSRDQ
jgi:hypothetical protein